MSIPLISRTNHSYFRAMMCRTSGQINTIGRSRQSPAQRALHSTCHSGIPITRRKQRKFDVSQGRIYCRLSKLLTGRTVHRIQRNSTYSRVHSHFKLKYPLMCIYRDIRVLKTPSSTQARRFRIIDNLARTLSISHYRLT